MAKTARSFCGARVPAERRVMPSPLHRRAPLRPFRSREAIIVAARAVFARQPWQTASMNDIAAEAGVTRRTLYNQFVNAEELVRAAHEDLILEIVDIVPLGVSARLGPPAALRAYCDLLVQTFREPLYSELVGFIVRDSWAAPWLCEAYNRLIRTPLARSLETSIQALRSDYVASGAIARREAFNLLTSLEAIALSGTLLPGPEENRPRTASCTADFVDGFMTRVARASTGAS